MAYRSTEDIIASHLASVWPHWVSHTDLIAGVRWRRDWKRALRKLIREGVITRRVERVSGKPGRPLTVYRHGVFDEAQG